jgi:CBS domain-containing protein
MKVLEVMTRAPLTCRPTASLASCALQMWDGDFGFLPVVDERDEVVGVLTDRDICMAVAMHDRRPGEIPVQDVMARDVHTCSPDDAVHTVLRKMAELQVRRLPVTDAQGILRGVVTLNDLALSAGEAPSRPGRPGPVPGAELLATLRAISRHRATVETA